MTPITRLRLRGISATRTSPLLSLWIVPERNQEQAARLKLKPDGNTARGDGGSRGFRFLEISS